MSTLTDGTTPIRREHDGLRIIGASIRTPCNNQFRPENLQFGPGIASDFERSWHANGGIWAEGYTQHSAK